MSWISIEDRLPKDSINVLINTMSNDIFIGWYNSIEGSWFIDKGELIVTHWQELPLPPKPTIKPCPFCNGLPFIDEIKIEISCCSYVFRVPYYCSIESLIEKYNNRSYKQLEDTLVKK